jgi:hypothetical protein
MNDDYLWDKTGEPDPQIQQLEEILGTLRCQPKPLEIPSDLQPRQKRNYFSWLAIAAALLLAMFAGGLWLATRSGDGVQPKQAKVVEPARVEEKTPGPSDSKTPQPKRDSREEVVVVQKPHRKSSRPVFSKQEREEALLAKEQVMLALRLTTEKLSLVHKKTQNTNQANQIKNQHRVG